MSATATEQATAERVPPRLKERYHAEVAPASGSDGAGTAIKPAPGH